MSRRFISVTYQVSLVILLALIVGIGSITFYLTRSLTMTIQDKTDESLDRESTLVYQAIEQLMIPGQAPLAVDYFERISGSDQRITIRLYRRDGIAAFSDNDTIREVNERFGMERFEERPEDEPGAMDYPSLSEDPTFQEVVALPATPVTEFVQTEEATVVQLYQPLLNLPKCTGCHGSDHTVRGVIDIRADITDATRQQQMAIATSSGGFVLLVLIVGLATTRLMRTRFIRPLKEIQSVCVSVSDGDFEQRTSIDRNDELGVLGRTVNSMVEGLYERFVLSRYVSSSTIASLRSSSESREEAVTMLFSDIRGFTSFTENNEPKTVVDTLNRVLARQSEIINAHGGDIDKYVGDEIVAVFFGEDCIGHACEAALEIQSHLAAAISETTDQDPGIPVKVGIGIHHGPVIVGQIGSERRADFTTIGDNVNVAARLCTAAGPDEIILSEAVAGTLRERREDLAAGLDGPFRLQVKGKADPLRVYKLSGSVAEPPTMGESS